MAKLVFDTLQYARQLRAAGIPDEQAEVHAELMGQAFSYYIGELVTKEYLDTTLSARFAEQEARIDARFQAFKVHIEARMDSRLQALEASIDKRFLAQDARMDQRFLEQDARMDRGFAELKSQLRLHNWVLALLAAAILLPKLSALVTP
jgi:hypothetical protein